MSKTNLTDISRTIAQHGRWLRRVRPLIAIACGLAFLSDLRSVDTLAVGVIYLPMICMALLNQSRRGIWGLAALAIVMVCVGAFAPDISPDLPELIGNRILSILAILLTAALVSYACTTQELLIEQTRRAEDAEHVKTELLTNLGSDLREPLHAIIGMATLMSADCQPHQREPLRQVQSAGRRLLATVGNLVDLAKTDQPVGAAEPVDLQAILQRVVETTRPRAAERQIAIAAEVADDVPAFAGNPWAVRRIIENILDNAVKLSPPGSVVRASIAVASGAVAVTVSDVGSGLPTHVLPLVSQPIGDAPDEADTLRSAGVGLTLCRRLADLIGAELSFRSEPASGTIATLRFPTVA